MRKIITILFTLIFAINLSVNAEIINVNEYSSLLGKSKEETSVSDKKIYKDVYENNEVVKQKLNINSEVEKPEMEKKDDSIILNELNTSIMHTVRIKNGEVYEFTNNSDNYIKLEFIIGDQDVAYDYYYHNSREAMFDSKDERHIIYSNQKIIFSVSKGEYLDILVPYEFKDSLKKLSTPMFRKIEIKKGNSYELKSSEYTILFIKDKNNEFRYDSLTYDNNGNHIETYTDRNCRDFFVVRENETFRIAMNNKSNMEKLEFYIPYRNSITVKELNNPLIKTITLDIKKNYEIVNKMENKYSLKTDDRLICDIIDYDKNYNVTSINTDMDFELGGLLKCDGKIRILSKGNNINFYVPYEFKYELNTINDPLTFKTHIFPDKTYEINNSYLNIGADEFDYMIHEFDVIQYGANGDLVEVNHVNGSTYIGGYDDVHGITKIRLIKGEKLDLVLPYENRNNIKETNGLLLKEIPLQKNKEYKIKNNNSFDIAVGTDVRIIDNIIDNVSYKITYYDSNGNIKEILDDKINGFKIKANESVKLSINNDGYNLHIPYEATIVDDDLIPDFNNDGKVDILDVSILALKYNKQKGEIGWDSIYDLNNDFIVDIFDLSIVAKKL